METIQILKSIENSKHFKSAFRIYFEGVKDYSCDELGWLVKPINNIQINKFEITDLEIDFQQSQIMCYITLCRPGLLIGKGGQLLTQIENYLSDTYGKKVKFIIKESNLWN